MVICSDEGPYDSICIELDEKMPELAAEAREIIYDKHEIKNYFNDVQVFADQIVAFYWFINTLVRTMRDPQKT